MKKNNNDKRTAVNGSPVSQDTGGLEYLDLDALLQEQASSKPRKPAGESDAPAGRKADEASVSGKAPDTQVSVRSDTAGEKAGDTKVPAPRKVSRRPRHNDDRESLQERFRDPAFWVHILLPAAIVAIALFAFIRYQIWARGEKIVIDQDNESRFSIEVNDNMVLLPESRLEGHEDDGVTTILCLGDAPFSDAAGENGLAGQISALSGATTINAAFPDSQVACFNKAYKTDTQHDMDDIFNLFYVSYAISIGDYTAMENVAKTHTDNDQFLQSVTALENTDFSKVDIIAIMYDGIDYENSSPLTNPALGLTEQLETYQGAMSNAFQALQNKYPYIRIVFLSPTYMLREDENGELQDARTDNFGNGTLIQYWQYAYDTCGDNGVSFLDNYYGSINENNYTEYLSDNIHLNDAGRTKVADHFVYKVINNEYAEYDAGSLAVASAQ